MPRFFFDVVNSIGFVRDDEGAELPDAAAARLNALHAIRSILAEEVRRGRIDLRGRIEVREESGPGFTVPYGQAAEVLTGELPSAAGDGRAAP
jgi:hypothetical protein